MKRLVLVLLLIVFGAVYYLNGEVISESVSLETTDNKFKITDSFSDDTSEPTYYSSISINYLQDLEIDSEELVIEQTLSPGTNYQRYIASYLSDGNKIFGLLTIPNSEPPEGGYPAIVFNHGYIPPSQYVTTEKYIAYVDTLARNDFVVFKIDMRGHGNSEGNPTGSYFSSGYTIDAVSALKSLQKYSPVNPNRIGMWGHSMAGNLLLRAMLIEDDIKAGVIWAGAVYSYEDFAEYRLNDGSYVRRPDPPERERDDSERLDSNKVQELRDREVDFSDPFWKSISLTQNIEFLSAPIQLHHSVDDPVVNIGYAYDLAEVLDANNKEYEIYEYAGGGHNINSPYFETAMQRTVEFFKNHL